MDDKFIEGLLNDVKNGNIDINKAVNELKKMPYEDLGFAKLDYHRKQRKGTGEVVYCAGKTPEQCAVIFEKLMEHNSNVLGTRASREIYTAVKKKISDAVYNESAKTITVINNPPKSLKGKIIVATGGTSDIPVAEEAAITAEFLGKRVERLYDVGVAGIHRLLMNINILAEANVIIAVAGMEGALPSVIAGLVDCPVIAVPTSIGYGANLGGLSALMTMLNSCASGIGVVNIDNGFGAGYLANTIIDSVTRKTKED